MISYTESYQIVKNEFQKLKLEIEEVDLLNSLNRILADDVYSDINQPPFHNSAMDGFAIKFNPNIKKWKIIGEISAGNYNQFTLDDESAVLIMTGGKIPENTSAILPVEDLSLIHI